MSVKSAIDKTQRIMVKWTDALLKLIYAVDAWQLCKISYRLKIGFVLKWTDAESKHIYAVDA